MLRSKYRSCVVLAILVLWALAMSGCEQKTISEIKADPHRYADHDVSVVGNVTRSVSVLGMGAYEIEDGTGKLWIISKTGVPREGARAVVKGKIRDGYNLGSIVKLPEQISTGMVLIEESHNVKD
jgi:hypothetical protein